MAENDPWMTEWLALADEVVRCHRRGRVLRTDPAFVLRGLPAMWSPATDDGDPGQDLVALAGAAVDHLDLADPVRPLLVQAAAGCFGRDLPALLRQVRTALDAAGPTAPEGGMAHVEHGPGRRLAGLGALGLVVLAALGLLAGREPGAEPAGTPLGADPLPVPGSASALVWWEPPHLVVEVASTRYRYRLEGEIDRLLLASTEQPEVDPTLVAERGNDRWVLEVPALNLAPDATDPAPDSG